MECTQKIDNTNIDGGNKCPEQVGFLGICGNEYPVYKGQNKIGRDPKMCNVVLNLNSISRQHVVLNILSKDNIIIMDLNSANKTMILDETLIPYIPYPLKDGDTFQLGDALAILQLWEEDDEIPMTQVIDIADTPVHTRTFSRLNVAKTIPESPDKDESIVVPAHPKTSLTNTISNDSFIKPSNKNYNQTNKSFNKPSDDADINEMETQIPEAIEGADSIHTAETQISTENLPLQSIHFLETQIFPAEQLPEVCIFPQQKEIELNLCTGNKDIHEADTQVVTECEKETEIPTRVHLSAHRHMNGSTKKNNASSDEEILFNEFDGQPFEDNFESQRLLPIVSLSPNNGKEIPEKIKDNIYVRKPVSELDKTSSYFSTDYEDIDIIPSQKIVEYQVADDDETDCDDILNENETNTKTKNSTNINKSKVSSVKIDVSKSDKEHEDCFEDMLTQIVPVEIAEGECKVTNACDENDFENLPTQIVHEDMPNNSKRIENTQQYSEEIIRPFKIPLTAVYKTKTPELNKSVSKSSPVAASNLISEDIDKYYESTQDIHDDLCSQNLISSTIDNINSNSKKSIDVVRLNTSDKSKCLLSDESTALKPLTLVDIDLPNSPEIIAKVNKLPEKSFTELFSDSESENNSEELITPNSKTKLNKYSKLPTRFTTRKHKPTAKLIDSNQILRNSFLPNPEEDIDKEIIIENLSRLKSNNNKNPSSRESNLNNKSKDIKIAKCPKSLNKKENKDINETLKTLQKNENKFKPPKRKNDKDIKKSNSIDEPRQSSKRLRKDKSTSDKTNEHHDNVNNDNKKVTKTHSRNKTHTATSEPNTSENISFDSNTSGKNRRKSKNKVEREPVKENVEIRRSTRQKNKDKLSKPDHSILKHKDDQRQSEVYDEPSVSRPESNNSLKRLAVEDEGAPSIKRLRSENTNSVLLRSSSARSLRNYRVLFTAFPYDNDIKLKLEKLGAIFVTDVMQCSAVVTSKVKRTLKLLCAVGLGLPIVGPDWMKACIDRNGFIDPWQHILKDEVQENLLNFNLAKTLRGKRGFLRGYNVSSTPEVYPKPSEMKLIVECSGGNWKQGGPRWVCISTYADKALWPDLKRQGATIVTVEFILTGVLTQKVDLKRHKFKEE